MYFDIKVLPDKMINSQHLFRWISLRLLITVILMAFNPVWAASNFTVSAGNNQTIAINKTVNLTGSASGAKGGVKKWYWQQIQGPTKAALKTAINNPSASFVAKTAGNYIFTLTATDASNSNAYALTFVTVSAGNKAVAVSLLSQSFQNNQTINLGSSQSLSWILRNDSGISLNNVLINQGTGNGGLTYGTISPSAIASWASGETKVFTVTANAGNNLSAGVYNQNWTLSYNFNQSLVFSNANDGIKSSLSIPQSIKLSQISQTFDNNISQPAGIIKQGSTSTITWQVRNDSNTNLTNVSLLPSTPVGSLSIGNITPATISTWNRGDTQTFQVQVTAPNNILAGTHSQSWGFSFNNLNYLTIGFIVKTPVPNIALDLLSAYFTDTNEKLTDGAVVTQGSSRTINWIIQNNSSISLNTVSLTPGKALGDLQISSLSPATLNNWAIGDSKTLSVTVTAPVTAWSDRHSQTWQLAVDGNQTPLNNQKTIGFSLTTNPLECAISSNPTSQSSPIVKPSLIKINSLGLVAISNNNSQKSSQWACVHDSNSHLMWEVKTNDAGLRDYQQTYNWQQANNYVQTVNRQGLCGFNDWRLPRAEELLTLISAKETDGVYTLQRLINIDFFPNSQASNYWSASDSADAFAWAVSFDGSQKAGGDYTLLDETSLNYVRLVRDAP